MSSINIEVSFEVDIKANLPIVVVLSSNFINGNSSMVKVQNF